MSCMDEVFGKDNVTGTCFLRPVMLVSAAHPEIKRRGSYYGRELGDLVTGLLMRARDDIDYPDPETAVRPPSTRSSPPWSCGSPTAPHSSRPPTTRPSWPT